MNVNRIVEDDWCVVGDDTSSVSSTTSASIVPSVPSSTWDMVSDHQMECGTPSVSEADTPRDVDVRRRRDAARRMAEAMGGPWAVIESNTAPEILQRHKVRNTRSEKCRGGKHWNSPPCNLMSGAAKYTLPMKMC